MQISCYDLPRYRTKAKIPQSIVCVWGILSIAFGRFLGLSEEDPELLCLCGMLHDVGKAKVPEDILNNPGRLTHIEYEIMTAHTLSGKQVLDELGEVTRLIKETAVYHHERVDGRGYLEQRNASTLHHCIRMVSIVDVYDAITSQRPYKDGQPAFGALKILFAGMDKHFDKVVGRSLHSYDWDLSPRNLS